MVQCNSILNGACQLHYDTVSVSMILITVVVAGRSIPPTYLPSAIAISTACSCSLGQILMTRSLVSTFSQSFSDVADKVCLILGRIGAGSILLNDRESKIKGVASRNHGGHSADFQGSGPTDPSCCAK